MYRDLLLNASLLIALTSSYTMLARLRKGGAWWVKGVFGLLFGVAAIVGMTVPFHYAPGVFYDGRSIVLSLAGLFGGGTAAAISILIAGAYRFSLGGAGVWAGLASIASSALVGLVWRRLCHNRPETLRLASLLALGVVVHVVVLACQLLVQPWPSGLTIIAQIWAPYLLVFSLATMLIGSLWQSEERRIRAEIELRESEASYRDLVQTAQDLIWQCDAQGRYTYLNPAWEEVFGYRVEEMLGKPFTDFQSPEYAERDKRRFARLLENGGVKGYETVHLSKDGRPIHLVLNAKIVTDEAGRVKGIRGTAYDLSQRIQTQRQIERLLAAERAQRRLAEALLKSSEQLSRSHSLEDLLDIILSSVALVIPYDTCDVIRYEGEMARVLRGRLQPSASEDAEAPIQWPQGRVYPLALLGDQQRIIATRQSLVIPDTHAFEDWTVFPESAWIRSLVGVPLVVNGEVIGSLNLCSRQPGAFDQQTVAILEAFASQVSLAIERGELLQQIRQHAEELEERVAERTAELQRINEELKEANRRYERTSQQLQAVNAELEAFTYSVSHDLKAPLRGIEGYSTLLLRDYEGQLDEGALYYVHRIGQAARQMSQLIDDLLAYSRLERRALSTITFPLAPFVESLLSERQTEIQTTGAQVSLQVACHEITADREGLSIALRNLIDNALKFSATSRPPQIEIGARLEAGRCLIWVKDNGIGFEMQYQERIFEIFQRLHPNDEFPGTGVGLAIVRKAMQRMGGRAWAESTPGQGAIFYLEIPQ